MIIYKTTIKLKNEFKITKYTKTKPDIAKEIMRAWHNYCDGFELSDEEFEEFEDFKSSIKYKTKRVIVL